MAFGPDGQMLASGSVDGTVRLWRVSDGALVRTLKHPGGVTSVEFSPDGRWVACGSYDRAVRLWRVSDGALVHTLSGHSDTVWSLAFSPDGRYLASGSRDRAALGGLMKQLFGARLARSRGRTIRLWRVQDGALLQTLSGHSDDVHCVRFSPDGRLLASSGSDKTVVLWQLERAKT